VDSASRLTEAKSLNLFVTFAVDLQKWHFYIDREGQKTTGVTPSETITMSGNIKGFG